MCNMLIIDYNTLRRFLIHRLHISDIPTFFRRFAPENTDGGKDKNWRKWTPASVSCSYPAGQEITPCLPWKKDCLFDLTSDPCEQNNIASVYPTMLRYLQQKIRLYNATAVPPQMAPFDPAASADLWDGWAVPWLDPQPMDNGITTNPFGTATPR